jgi:hypothetical protein
MQTVPSRGWRGPEIVRDLHATGIHLDGGPPRLEVRSVGPVRDVLV